MKKTKEIEEFLNDPIVRQAYREDGIEEVARLASMIGNLEKNFSLRELAEVLSQRAFEEEGG